MSVIVRIANENLYSIRTNCAVYSIDARRLTEEGKRFSVADDDKAATGGILEALQPFISLTVERDSSGRPTLARLVDKDH